MVLMSQLHALRHYVMLLLKLTGFATCWLALLKVKLPATTFAYGLHHLKSSPLVATALAGGLRHRKMLPPDPASVHGLGSPYLVILLPEANGLGFAQWTSLTPRPKRKSLNPVFPSRPYDQEIQFAVTELRSREVHSS